MAWGASIALTLLVCLPAAAEPNGLKLGSGRLHPGLSVEGQFDSRVKADDISGEAVPELVFHIRPALDFESRSSSVHVTFRGQGDLNLYSGLLSATNRSLTYFGGDADLGLDVNPDGRVGFVVGDRFAHSDRTSAVGIGSGVLSTSNELSLAIPVRPGGRALEIRPAYTFGVEAFTEYLTAPLGVTLPPSQLNYFSHRPSLQGKWKFLPKTALIVDVSSDLRQYVATAEHTPVRGLYARAGLSGLVTPQLSVVVNAGYGNAFVSRDAAIANYENVIGQAEVAFIPAPTARLKVGYTRTFSPVPVFGWFGNNRLYFGASAFLGGRVVAEGTGSFDLVQYAGPAGGTAADRRTDTVLSLDLLVRVRITQWLDVGGGYRVEGRTSSAPDPSLPSGASLPLDYARHQVGIRISARY